VSTWGYKALENLCSKGLMQTQKDTEYIRLEFLIQINTTRESLNKVWEIE